SDLLRQVVAWSVGQFLAEQADPPTRRALGQVKQLKQRRLARARRPGEEIEAAARQPEVEVAQHFGARAVAQAHTVEFGKCSQNPSLPGVKRAPQGPSPCQA